MTAALLLDETRLAQKIRDGFLMSRQYAIGSSSEDRVLGAYDALDELLAEVARLQTANENADELIRDAMDVVVGYCSPTARANRLQVIESVLMKALDALSAASPSEAQAHD